jgi:serine/arginine repetitive matrix protein 2
MSNIQELTSVDRPSSRGSVNFSLPTSLRRSSSAAQWMLTPRQSSQAINGSELVFDPNTRTLRTRADMLFYEQGLREASQKPVMRKKSLRQGQGSHFSEGSVGGRLKGTALDSIQRQNVHERQAQQTSQGILSEEFPRSQRVASPRNSIRDSSDNESEASERTSKYNNRVESQQLSNKPSIVREERQREEDEDDSVKVLGRQAALRKLESANRDDRHISPSPLPRSKSGRVRKQAGNIGSNVEQDQPRMQVTEAPVTQAETAPTPAPIPAPAQISAPVQETAPKPEAPIVLSPLDTATKALRMEKQAVDRAHSLSPTRAHFLATPSPVSQFSIRHEPPARSISPRKSALKPSPSPRGPSPMGYTPTGWTAGPSSGDVSDASTNQSEERIVPKKKSVRVSFDERNNVVVGEEPDVPDARRTWTSGYIRGNKATSPIQDGPDEIMGPRPVLPSFGSVRKNHPRDLEDRPLVKPVGLQGTPPAISPSNNRSEYFTGQSSDYAVGSLLQQERNLRDAPSVSNSNDPLPPEVTSVEGSGYVSDSGSSTHSFVVGKAVAVPVAVNDGDTPKTVEAGGKPGFIEDLGVIPEVETPGDDAVREQLEEFPTELRQDDTAAHDSKTNGNGNAPTFTVTQPTPLPEQGEFQHQISAGLNDNTWESANEKEIPLKDYIAGNEVAGGPVAVQNILGGHPVTVDEESSDGDSIYSDAAEELSDNGDGFMSLDAVLGSTEPSVKPVETPKAPDSGEGWDESQRFWSGLSADKRRQMELDALLENDEDREVSEDEVPDLKPLKQVSVAKAQATRKEKQSPNKAVAVDRTYQIAPGAKAGPDGVPSMRTSLRAPKPRQEEGQMRMSMRDNAGGSMRSNASGRPREGKKLQAGGAAAAMKANAPKPPAPAPTPKPTLRRSASVESDSSFVRDRPRKDGFQMKRSMRGSYSREAPTLRGPGPIDATPAQSSRFSIRSLSPSSRRLSVSSTTRQTPSLRAAPDEPPKSPRRLFSRTKAIPAPKAFKPSSRFADSSDEEDARPATTFRSRFAGSSDEEDDAPPPPATGSFRRSQSLRPIPRTSAADGDSSDLPDSDDSSPFRGASGVNAAALRMARANFQAGGNATEISAAGFREAPRKKGGLMSILRRKKPEQSGRIQRTDWGESAARRDTPLERSKADLELVKSRDANVKAAQSPRLQKRAGPSRTVSYQAPPAVEAQADGRPATSDGVADGWKANGDGVGVVNGTAASRPGVLRRNNTAGSVEIVGGDAKKKKFGRLRRLFGN